MLHIDRKCIYKVSKVYACSVVFIPVLLTVCHYPEPFVVSVLGKISLATSSWHFFLQRYKFKVTTYGMGKATESASENKNKKTCSIGLYNLICICFYRRCEFYCYCFKEINLWLIR